MEDYFDKLLYLVVGFIYFFLGNAKRSNTEKQIAEDRPPRTPTVPAAESDWGNTWEDQTREEPTKKLRWQPIVREALCLPTQRATTQLANQQWPKQQINRTLHRYGGWKKAVIMSELIRPYG